MQRSTHSGVVIRVPTCLAGAHSLMSIMILTGEPKKHNSLVSLNFSQEAVEWLPSQPCVKEFQGEGANCLEFSAYHKGEPPKQGYARMIRLGRRALILEIKSPRRSVWARLRDNLHVKAGCLVA